MVSNTDSKHNYWDVSNVGLVQKENANCLKK